MSTAFGLSTVLGYPRIGANRELKRAVEAFWSRRSPPAPSSAPTPKSRSLRRA